MRTSVFPIVSLGIATTWSICQVSLPCAECLALVIVSHQCNHYEPTLSWEVSVSITSTTPTQDQPMPLPSSGTKMQQPQQRVLWMLTPAVRKQLPSSGAVHRWWGWTAAPLPPQIHRPPEPTGSQNTTLELDGGGAWPDLPKEHRSASQFPVSAS